MWLILQGIEGRSEEYLSVILEATNAALWDWNLRTNEVRVTARWHSMLGNQSDDFIISAERWQAAMHPGDRAVMVERMKAYAGGIVPVFDAEWRGLHRDGSVVWVHTRALAVERDEEGLIRLIGTNIDITDTKRAEQALRERSEELRQSQKMEAVGRLAGGIAHDFNNLLMVISASAEFLEQATAMEDPRHDDIDEIRRATARAASLTRQLLAFSRKQVLQPVTFLMNDAMAEMERLLQRVIGKDVEFALNVDPAAGAVLADVGQIEQVVMNLVVNARDAMPDGGVVVLGTKRVSRKNADGSEGWGVQLFVADTGTGMTPEVVAHAFDPFFTTKGPGKGTGLGLSMVYGIVQQSGGDVEIHSRPGMGTRIDITFPEVATVASTELTAPAKAPRSSSQGTLLVIDDEDAVRRATRRILERSGYEVLEARSGREALEQWQRHSHLIAAIVSDVVMPGMPATAVVEQARLTRPDVPVVFISGHSDAKLVGKMVNERTRVLAKPFSATSLLDAIGTVME